MGLAEAVSEEDALALLLGLNDVLAVGVDADELLAEAVAEPVAEADDDGL